MPVAEQLMMTLSGSALKIQGMSMAIEHAEIACPGWTDRTIEALRVFCIDIKRSGHGSFVMEDFRSTREHDLPISHKSWGSIPVIATRRGIISATGEYRQAKSIKTHSHPVRVWIAL